MKLKLRVQDIDEKKFFAMGKYAFLIIAVMMLAGFIDNIRLMAGWEIIKQFAIIVFNFAVMGYFSYMLEKQKKLSSDQDAEKFALEVEKMLKNEPKRKIATKYKKK